MTIAEETAPPGPQAPKVPSLTYLSRLLLAITCLLGMALTGAGLALFQQRYVLLAQGMGAVEAIATEALGVKVSIGDIHGPYWNGFELTDVRLYGSKVPGAPVIAAIPRVHAFYSLLEILKLGRQPIVLDAYDPKLTLSRDAHGKLDYQPTFKKGPQEPTRLPKLPVIRVRLHDGMVRWRDRMPQAGFESTYRELQARCDLVDKRLVFTARTHEGPTRIELDGSYAIEEERGSLRARVKDLSTSRWINYLAPNPQMTITGGDAGVEARISWAPGVFKLNGSLAIHRMSLTQLGLLLPVEGIEAAATFDNHVATVTDVHGMLAGNRFQGAGVIRDLDHVAPRLDFQGEAKDIDIPSLLPLVPDLAAFRLAGKGTANVVVSGTTLRPVVDAQAHIPEGHVLEQLATNVTAAIHVDGIDVSVPVWQGALNGGHVTGSSWFTLEPEPRITTEAQWSRVRLLGTLLPYLKKSLPLRGELQGDITFSGTAKAPVASGSLQIAEGRYYDQEFSIAHADFSYRGHEWFFTDGVVGFGDARLNLSTRVHENGVFAGRFAGTQFPLSALAAFGVEAPVTGKLNASGSFAGDAMHPEDLQAHGVADVLAGSVMSQSFEHASTQWSLSKRQLDLQRILVGSAGGKLAGDARINLETRAKFPVVHAEFAADHVELERLEPVQAALVSQIGPLTGRVSATGSIDSDGQDWRVQAETVASSVDAERLGTLHRVSGPLYFGHQRLSFPELAFKLGKATAGTLQGSLDFSQATPSAELELAVHNAPAKDIETAIHWQELLQGTWIGRKFGAKAPTGPLRTMAVLAAQEGAQASGSLSLKAVLDHWTRHHLEPLTSGSTYQATKPIWQSIDGLYSLDMAYEGLVSNPEVRIRLGLKEGMVYGHPLRRAHLVAVYRDKHLHVPVFDAIEARDGGVAVQARGVLGTDGVLEVYGNNLDLRWANSYLQAQEVELGGKGSFTLLAKGDPSDPRLEIAAGVSNGSIGPAGSKDPADLFTFNQADAKATYYRGRLSIDSGKVLKEGKEALVSGVIPILPGADNRLDLSIDLQGESLGIVSAFTRGEIQWKGGPGRALLNLSGSLEDPQLSGTIDLQGVAIRDRNLKSDITDIRGLATIATDSVTIQRATAHYGGGTLVATGQLYLTKFVPDRLRLQTVARQVNFELANGLYKGMVEASLEINGTIKHPVIGGTVALSRGTLDLDALTPAEGIVPAEPQASPIEIKDLSLHVHQGVNVLGPTQAVARLFEAGIGGSLTINGMLDAPQARGNIKILGGILTPLNNPFDIVAGNVEFLGSGVQDVSDKEDFEDLLPLSINKAPASKLPNARLNVIAKGQIYDYNPQDFPPDLKYKTGGMLDIKVTVSGSLQNMERKFECTTPSLQYISQDRIEKVLGKEALITGIFKGQAGQAADGKEDFKDIKNIVTNEVSGFLSTASRRFFDPYTSKARELLPLESLGFDVVPLEQQALFANLGLSPSLYTETREFFGSLTLSGRYTIRPDHNVYQVGLNYRFNQYLSLQAGVDNNRGSVQGEVLNPAITLSTQRRF